MRNFNVSQSNDICYIYWLGRLTIDQKLNWSEA